MKSAVGGPSTGGRFEHALRDLLRECGRVFWNSVQNQMSAHSRPAWYDAPHRETAGSRETGCVNKCKKPSKHHIWSSIFRFAAACAFCVDINSATALKRGLTEAKLADVAESNGSEYFEERERAVLRYAEAATWTHTQPEAAHFDELRRWFDDDGIVELTGLIAFRNLSSKFNAALGVEPQGFCRLPPRALH